MSLQKRLLQFCNDNVVMISGIAIIIGIHWSWLKIQNVPSLVNPAEKKELPIVIGAKYLYRKVVGAEAEPQTKEQ